MPKLTNAVPKYRKHKPSGQAIVTLNGRDFYLGPWGTKESREKYDRLISEWTGGGRQPLATDDTGLTVGECVSRYWAEHVKPRFEPLNVATAQSDNLRAALPPLLALYDSELASKFGPNALRIVRDKMVESGLARTTINRRTKYIVAIFKWLSLPFFCGKGDSAARSNFGLPSAERPISTRCPVSRPAAEVLLLSSGRIMLLAFRSIAHRRLR